MARLTAFAVTATTHFLIILAAIAALCALAILAAIAAFSAFTVFAAGLIAARATGFHIVMLTSFAGRATGCLFTGS